MTPPEGEGVPLRCADLRDKSERSVQDAATCHEGPTMLEDERVQPCSPVARRIFSGRPKLCPGYSELTRGKAACHLVSPILWQSTLTRSGWRHGMAMTAMLPAFG
jgi:hypothetical protein